MIWVLIVMRSDCNWSEAGEGSSLYPGGGPEDRGFNQDKSGTSECLKTIEMALDVSSVIIYPIW